MKKYFLISLLVFPALIFGQSARDINSIIQKTIDLNALKTHFNDAEKAGETPLIIINDAKIPNNLMIFKFNKRVKIMTKKELETFKAIYNGNLDSFFVFEIMEFTGDEVKIKAVFRKETPISIQVSMQKQNKQWKVTESSAG